MHRFFLNNWIIVQVTSLKFKSCILLTTKGASFCIRTFGFLLNSIWASKQFDNAKVRWWAWTNFGPYHKHWGSTYVLKHCRPCYNFNLMMLECLIDYIYRHVSLQLPDGSHCKTKPYGCYEHKVLLRFEHKLIRLSCLTIHLSVQKVN